MAQVFISYSRRDLTFVDQLVSDLKETGIDVWYDLAGLEGGSRFGTEIQNAIKNSDYVIVVLSPDSVKSEWVEREYMYSDNLNKKVLPLMYRECELPLSFLNVNYVDVQGENYSRNFEKITRFLNKEPLPASSIERTSRGNRPGVTSFAMIGVVAVLGVSVFLLLFNARNTNGGPGPVGTNLPVQTAIQPTSSPNTAVNQVTESSTPVRPTSTQRPPTPVSMVSPVPAQAEVPGQAAFIHKVLAGNMIGNKTDIEHPLASDPNALVFATSNYWPGGDMVYNPHNLGVWFIESQWALFNQTGFMPQDAAFNVQILNPSDFAFIHTATASNIKDNWTTIEHPLASDPNALVFAMPNYNPPERPHIGHDHPIGVWYVDSHWAIFNQDRALMNDGVAFNIQILSPTSMTAFVHTATASNILKEEKQSTEIDSLMENNPDALVFVMPRSQFGDTAVYNNHPIGVYHNGKRWVIFNEDRKPMPVGAEFNVLILDVEETPAP